MSKLVGVLLAALVASGCTSDDDANQPAELNSLPWPSSWAGFTRPDEEAVAPLPLPEDPAEPKSPPTAEPSFRDGCEALESELAKAWIMVLEGETQDEPLQ